jgi:hypothetical protein
MKTKTPTAPAATPSVEESAALVETIKADIAATKTQIETAESERDAKALTLSDAAFEAHVLETERKKRSLLRLQKQLEVAQAQHTEAKERDKEQRRAALYEAALAAEKAVESLAEEYAKRAAAVVETLRKIDDHAEVIRIGNANLEHYTLRIEPRGILLGANVVLPHPTAAYEYIWSHGEPAPRPPKEPERVWVGNILTYYDASNPDHVAARTAEQSKPAITPVARRPAPQESSKFGERILEDGSRRITLPPNEWPPRAESN